jgi:hypothetical protein
MALHRSAFFLLKLVTRSVRQQYYLFALVESRCQHTRQLLNGVASIYDVLAVGLQVGRVLVETQVGEANVRLYRVPSTTSGCKK